MRTKAVINPLPAPLQLLAKTRIENFTNTHRAIVENVSRFPIFEIYQSCQPDSVTQRHNPALLNTFRLNTFLPNGEVSETSNFCSYDIVNPDEETLLDTFLLDTVEPGDGEVVTHSELYEILPDPSVIYDDRNNRLVVSFDSATTGKIVLF